MPIEATEIPPLVLENQVGLHWTFSPSEKGWTLGSIELRGERLEAPLDRGFVALRRINDGEVRWLAASDAKPINPGSARFTGEATIDGVLFSFSATVEISKDAPAASWTTSWTVDADLSGWEVCLMAHDTFENDWRVQSYPWAGNSDRVSISPMRYCGIPGVLMYRPDLSMVALFSIDSNTDYLNPTTWTGQTGFHFINGELAPQYRVGGGQITAGIGYEMPLQLILSDAGEFAETITQIMRSWITLNHYEVDTTLQVRTPREAFDLAVEGRRKMQSWKAGIGYEHHRGTPFIYIGNNPYIAFYEYRLHEITGESTWRERAFEQINFALKGQEPSGVFHTSWYFEAAERPDGSVAQGFCSWDWHHVGYKVDINVWMARHILQTWQRVKQHEGLDRQDWYKAAIASLDWVRAQQNEDGGLPQRVDIESGEKSASVVSGRALVAFPIIAEITGDDRYLALSEDLERNLRKNVEGRFCYTGMHPDLPPGDFEQDSIFAVIEYWLAKHERTGAPESLTRAIANAYFALLYWCPKQLSWVDNPTQCAHSEQQNFNQYSVYCYGNRKIQCLDQLFQRTGNPLFEQLKHRVMQLNFFTQVEKGPYRGAMTEAIADPWLEREGGFNHQGSPYTSELVADLMLQLMDTELNL